jgi:hypothetical protein
VAAAGAGSPSGRAALRGADVQAVGARGRCRAPRRDALGGKAGVVAGGSRLIVGVPVAVTDGKPARGRGQQQGGDQRRQQRGPPRAPSLAGDSERGGSLGGSGHSPWLT